MSRKGPVDGWGMLDFEEDLSLDVVKLKSTSNHLLIHLIAI